MITSRQNQRIKDAASLRERRQRRKQQRFLIEGVREVQRALVGGIPLLQVFLDRQHLAGADAATLVEALHQADVPTYDVSPEVFGKLAYGDRHEGVVAVGQSVSRSLNDIVLPPRPLIAVLEGIEKPGNLGAVARSADAAGVAALVVVGAGTDVYNPSAIRASLGTLFTVPVAEADAQAALTWAKGLELPILTARPDAEQLYTDVSFVIGAVLVLGSEARGLSDTWRDPAVIPIRLPMYGVADSLNVSATAAVLFYEAQRQRRG